MYFKSEYMKKKGSSEMFMLTYADYFVQAGQAESIDVGCCLILHECPICPNKQSW